MGRQKLLLPIDGVPLLARVVGACVAWPTVVVVSDPDVGAALAGTLARIIFNDDPDRGMNRSLALADAAVPRAQAIAVILGDLPDCDANAISGVIAAYDGSVDVVVPEAGGRLGHPVVMSPAARALIGRLGDGDGLRTIRDDPALKRLIVAGIDPGAFTDIDTPADYEARLRRARP